MSNTSTSNPLDFRNRFQANFENGPITAQANRHFSELKVLNRVLVLDIVYFVLLSIQMCVQIQLILVTLVYLYVNLEIQIYSPRDHRGNLNNKYSISVSCFPL